MNVPACAMPVLSMFRPAFSTPTDHRFLVLVLAAVLTTGRRTVTNLLRTVRSRTWVVLPPRVFPAPLVNMGAGAHIDHLPSRLCGLTRAGAPGGR